MLRLEVRNSQTPIERKPEWIKTRAKMGPEYTKMQSLVKSEGLHTGKEAGCPTSTSAGRTARRLPHRRRPVHQALRLLARSTPASRRPGRDEPRRRGWASPWSHGPELRHDPPASARDDLDGRGWRLAVRETVRRIHAMTGGSHGRPYEGRAAHPGLQRGARAAGEVFGSRPEVLAHNVADGARIFSGSAGLPLRALARSDHQGPRGRSVTSPT